MCYQNGTCAQSTDEVRGFSLFEKWEIDSTNRMLSTNNGNNTNDKNILVLSFCPVYCVRVLKKGTIGDNSLVALVTFTKILLFMFLI